MKKKDKTDEGFTINFFIKLLIIKSSYLLQTVPVELSKINLINTLKNKKKC